MTNHGSILSSTNTMPRLFGLKLTSWGVARLCLNIKMATKSTLFVIMLRLQTWRMDQFSKLVRLALPVLVIVMMDSVQAQHLEMIHQVVKLQMDYPVSSHSSMLVWSTHNVQQWTMERLPGVVQRQIKREII